MLYLNEIIGGVFNVALAPRRFTTNGMQNGILVKNRLIGLFPFAITAIINYTIGNLTFVIYLLNKLYIKKAPDWELFLVRHFVHNFNRVSI